MIVAVPSDSGSGERRVALTPESAGKLVKSGIAVHVEAGAGLAAGFRDEEYQDRGAVLVPAWPALYERADILLKVRPLGARDGTWETDSLREGTVVLGALWPLQNLESVRRLAAGKLTSLSLDQLPRITRAQPMDILSSQSTVAGYKAVLLAASVSDKFFPMLTTAAGTITPAKVLVIGAGVAGLQAIATARRLGAVIEGYDVRPAAQEQILSLGGKVLQMPVDTRDAEDQRGYAKAQSEETLRKQQMFFTERAGAYDVIITTAVVPGQRAPLLIPAAAVQKMRPGAVIVDLAAEQGGNCELTEPGQQVVKHGVTIIGLLNLPSTMPYTASTMFSRNLLAYLQLLVKDGKPNVDLGDELIRGPLITHQGEIVHEEVRKKLSLATAATT